MSKEHLAANCGLYCGACSLYRARRDNNPQFIDEMMQVIRNDLPVPDEKINMDEIDCDGCRAGGLLTSYCMGCKIRLCVEKKSDFGHCTECKDFPCSLIADFNNDGMPHHAEAVKNMIDMRLIGIKNWIHEQEKRWQCHACSTAIHWYSGTCPKCETLQPNRLLKLSKDSR
ncbi:MAG: DUF3795 domain-containing protein [Pseudomonadota bacterium]